MADDLALQNQIAALAGRINRHKTNESHVAPASYSYAPGRGNYLGTSTEPWMAGSHRSVWLPQRGSPYGVPQGRGRAARAPVYRNRSLVVNSGTPISGSLDSPTVASETHTEVTPPTWVTKRDRHMQLINSSVYEKKTQQRHEAIEETRRQKKHLQDEREKARVNAHFQSLHQQGSHYSVPATPPQIFIQDIRFLVADGGSKLIKAPGGSKGRVSSPGTRTKCNTDEANLVKTTPKQAEVGGVTFFRSKRGNLYRAGLVKSKRSEKISPTCWSSFTNRLVSNLGGAVKLKQPCPQFSTTGSLSPSSIGY